MQWYWIGNGLVGWLSIGNQVYLSRSPLAEWLTVALQWHQIGNGLVEWLSIRSRLI